MAALDDWVQLDEAVKIAGRSEKTIYRWARHGKVRTLRTFEVTWYNIKDLRTASRNTPGRPRKNM